MALHCNDVQNNSAASRGSQPHEKVSLSERKIANQGLFFNLRDAKGRTTALADYLRLHPELHTPARKELHFFDNESHDWLHPPYWQYHRCCRLSHPGNSGETPHL